jgi:hypothetical protein
MTDEIIIRKLAMAVARLEERDSHHEKRDKKHEESMDRLSEQVARIEKSMTTMKYCFILICFEVVRKGSVAAALPFISKMWG